MAQNRSLRARTTGRRGAGWVVTARVAPVLRKVYDGAPRRDVADRGAPRAVTIECRFDVLVGERVIVECKATVAYNRVFEAQALTYLRLSNLKLAIVINFGEVRVRQGIHRVVNGLQE